MPKRNIKAHLRSHCNRASIMLATYFIRWMRMLNFQVIFIIVCMCLVATKKYHSHSTELSGNYISSLQTPKLCWKWPFSVGFLAQIKYWWRFRDSQNLWSSNVINLIWIIAQNGKKCPIFIGQSPENIRNNAGIMWTSTKILVQFDSKYGGQINSTNAKLDARYQVVDLKIWRKKQQKMIHMIPLTASATRIESVNVCWWCILIAASVLFRFTWSVFIRCLADFISIKVHKNIQQQHNRW